MWSKYKDSDEQELDGTVENEELFRWHLSCEQSYTINGKAVLCFVYEGEGLYDLWWKVDSSLDAKALKDIRKLIDIYRKRGNIVYTASDVGNERIYRFLGFRKSNIDNGGKQIWV